MEQLKHHKRRAAMGEEVYKQGTSRKRAGGAKYKTTLRCITGWRATESWNAATGKRIKERIGAAVLTLTVRFLCALALGSEFKITGRCSRTEAHKTSFIT